MFQKDLDHNLESLVWGGDRRGEYPQCERCIFSLVRLVEIPPMFQDVLLNYLIADSN